MEEKPKIPDFPTLPDFGQMITQACEVVASVRGIPYDFNGTLSLENKFVVLFKTVKEMFNAQDALVKSYKELYEFINTYFTNLDVQEEINKKIQSMVADGSLLALVQPTISNNVSTWLVSNITNPSNPPIDKSLTVDNAAANSKTVGNLCATSARDLNDNNVSVINGDLNNVPLNTVYELGLSASLCKNLPNNADASGTLVSLSARGKDSNVFGVQILYDVYAGVSYRTLYLSKWKPWTTIAYDVNLVPVSKREINDNNVSSISGNLNNIPLNSIYELAVSASKCENLPNNADASGTLLSLSARGANDRTFGAQVFLNAYGGLSYRTLYMSKWSTWTTIKANGTKKFLPNYAYGASNFNKTYTKQSLEKAYLCIGMDDYRIGAIEGATKYMRDNNIPYYLAVYPRANKDNWKEAKLCVENGGEIIAHSDIVITSSNQTTDNMITNMHDIPQELTNDGFKISGVIAAGGQGADTVDTRLAQYYLLSCGVKYSDYGFSAPYNVKRKYMYNSTPEQIDTFLTELERTKDSTILYCHAANGTELGKTLEDFKKYIDVIKKHTAIEVITPNILINRLYYNIPNNC